MVCKAISCADLEMRFNREDVCKHQKAFNRGNLWLGGFSKFLTGFIPKILRNGNSKLLDALKNQ